MDVPELMDAVTRWSEHQDSCGLQSGITSRSCVVEVCRTARSDARVLSAMSVWASPGRVAGAGVVGEADGWVDCSAELRRAAVDHAWPGAHQLVDFVGVGGARLDVAHQHRCDPNHFFCVQTLPLIFREPFGQLKTPGGMH